MQILYKHRTTNIIKKNMRATAINYYEQNRLKKVFERLLIFNYKQKAKYAMTKLAQIHYKRTYMLRWIKALQIRQV